MPYILIHVEYFYTNTIDLIPFGTLPSLIKDSRSVMHTSNSKLATSKRERRVHNLARAPRGNTNGKCSLQILELARFQVGSFGVFKGKRP